MFHSILVPLDGSSFAEHALPFALSIAQRADVPLFLVHVHVPLAPMYAEVAAGLESTMEPRMREREKAYLESAVKRVSATGRLQVIPVLIDGPAAEAIREHAKATGADLIVMATHGRGPLSRFWLGSVADQLVRRSSVPILLVHPGEGVPDLASNPVPSKCLIPLDGSKLAEQILEPATALGRVMGADYTLLRVVEPAMSIGYDPVTYGGWEAIDERRVTREREEAQIYLNRVAERFRKQSLGVQTRVLTSHSPAVAILDEATTGGMSLIALQTHGRRGLARVLLGSVADKVVRGATTPVLILHPNSKNIGETQ
jgi:nucleotide-binding universal stress UspA family protein